MSRRYLILVMVLLLVLMSGLSAWAGPVEKKVLYQKKNVLLTYPKTYVMRFSLWDAEIGGTELWSEEKPINLTCTTIKTYLGENSPLDGLDFSQQLWVQVDKKKSDGTYKQIDTRDMLGVVPYALWSESAGGGGAVTSVTGGNGLTGGGTGDITLNVGAGPGITVGANDVSVNFAGSGSADTVSRSNHNHDATYVNQTGDTMSGTLNINIGSGNGLVVNNSGNNPSIVSNMTGTDRAGYFQINNASNSVPALYGETNGSGAAIYGYHPGGTAGYFNGDVTITKKLNLSTANGTAQYKCTNSLDYTYPVTCNTAVHSFCALTKFATQTADPGTFKSCEVFPDLDSADSSTWTIIVYCGGVQSHCECMVRCF